MYAVLEKMTSERWQQIDQLFHAALAYTPADRAGFLARACVGDERLRWEVESLISFHEGAQSFIETPPGDVAAELLGCHQSRFEPGEQIDNYRIVRQLGSGGMGEVYLADDTRLNRKIALKLLPPEYTTNADRVRRFEQEARAASALNHPNIVTIHEIGKSNSVHFIATEFIDGVTLREHLASADMTLGEVLDVAAQVASALAAAHEAGIVHRDIKPENIMQRRDGFVKVLDFGLAKLADSPAMSSAGASTKAMLRTDPGMVMGTAQYMSPEQARGQDMDQRTDLWSLGVVLYEMLTGRAPFTGETASHLIVSILESEPSPLACDAEVPDQLERIVAKALSKNREARYQTADELAFDLKSLKEELTVKSRLKQFGRPNVGDGEKAAWSAADAERNNSHSASAVTVAHLTSSAAHLVNGIKRHKGSAVFASVSVLLMVAALAYFTDFTTGRGEAIDSVAVMPFVNVGGNPDAEYLSDGISDSVITSLSHLPNLRVISLNAVLRYKGKQIDPQAVGRELNVRAVLVGRMTQQGDGLAISTELVDVSDNRRLWGEQYNRKLSDIITVHSEIAQQISSGLRLRLSGEDKKQLAKQYTENTDAYQLYILGRHYFQKETKEAYEKSIEYYELAIKADPNYALAYVALGHTYHWMGTRGFWPPEESEQKARWATLKALELDETLAEAHARLGGQKFNSFDWAGAEKDIKRALELDPNSTLANSAYFQYLAAIGRPEEALEYAIRAEKLEPSPENGGLAFAYFLARQYDKAIEFYLKGIAKNPDNPHTHILLGEVYAAKGMLAESVEEMQKGVALDASLAKTPERWDRYPMLAHALALAGRRDEALTILEAQKKLAKQRYVSPYNFALIYTGLGDNDQAFEWLAKCIEQRTRLVYRLKARPMFDPLRSDPRYTELLRRMNLEP